MGSLNIYNTSGANKASLTFTGSSDVTVDSNNLSGLTSNVQTQLGQMIGVGQTWQDVTASRSSGTTYTNTTGKPIAVNVRGLATSSGTTINLVINGTISIMGQFTSSTSQYPTVFGIIPNNATYQLTVGVGTVSVNSWQELR